MPLPRESELSWRILRLLRSDRSGAAGRGRYLRRNFGAALEQGE
jgi:hypothetical protein